MVMMLEKKLISERIRFGQTTYDTGHVIQARFRYDREEFHKIIETRA